MPQVETIAVVRHYSCVDYVRSKGVNMPTLGDAGNLDVNSPVPIKGEVMILVYHGLHHLAYIEKVEMDGVHISEANYLPGEITYRVIPTSDPHIVGYSTDNL